MAFAFRTRLFFVSVVVFACFVPFVSAQTVTQRGFADARLTMFPQDAPADAVNVVGDVLLREEVFFKPLPWLRFAAGVDVRGNTHDQVDTSPRIDIRDRGHLRPLLSIRRLGATFARGALTVDAGKQFIRWGKTDIVTPTDRFAPRDFLNVIDSEFLPVSGLRAVVEHRGHSVDVVWVPWFTPSRIPLLNQRWAPPAFAALAAAGVPVTIDDVRAPFPEGSQMGIRWSHVGRGFESALSVFDGYNHLPNVDLPLRYPRVRSYGADLAVPTPAFTIKGETAYFTSDTPATDEFVLYVIQVERQTGEWVLVGGYAGEVVTKRRTPATFAPDRGLTRAIVARASYTIDPNRSASIETAVRQNADGIYVKGEYSQASGQHWRATLSAAFIGGRDRDFLGQYDRNSHAALTVRYSF